MAEIHDYYTNDKEGDSLQDRLLAQMSPKQIHLYRQNAQKQAIKQGRNASNHNEYMDMMSHAIHTAERLTDKRLQTLIKNARSQSGIDAGEILDFTLGKTKKNLALKADKALSPDVLKYYLANVKQAANSFAGGISPRQVINQSRAVDIKRANEQIFLATTFKRQGNVLYFLTNAGIGSKSANHKVTVELIGYPMLMMGRTKMPTLAEIKELLSDGKIKFDCDCGRHQYWYRYIATVGKYNFGLHENRYPSTRNPELTGVACKHVLRVMQSLMGHYGQQKLKEYIKADLAKGTGKALSVRTSDAQLRKEAKQQATPASANHWRKRIEKKIQQQVKLALKELKPMTTQQQFQVMQQMKKVGIKFSPEQETQFTAYQNSQAPFIAPKR